MIDSLRGDILGNYGVSPHLDEFARESYVFEDHLVNAAWTRPSTLVFFTGKYASSLPVNFWDYPTTREEVSEFYRQVKYPLPRILLNQGMNTIMVGNNPFLNDQFGLGVNVGFKELYDFSNFAKDTPLITNKTLEVIDTISKEKNANPFFLFINFNDPHKPYTPPTGYTNRIQTKEILEERKRDYLGEVAYIDDQIKIIFDALKESGLYDTSLILITADHGEVMDPGHAISPFTGTNTFFGHGQDLFYENIHVPLLIKMPNQKQGRRIQKRTQSVDLYPFLLEHLNIPIPPEISGQSFGNILVSENSTERTYYGETRATQGVGIAEHFLLQKSFRFHKPGKFWKGFVGKEKYFYYDRKKDPKQLSPIIFSDLSELIDNQTLPEEGKSIISNLWNQLKVLEPPIPIYQIRVNLGLTMLNEVKIRLQTKEGSIRILESDDFQIDWQSNQNALLVWKDSAPEKQGSKQISFEVYPDVSFPQFRFEVNGKPVADDKIGIGVYEISPNACNPNCFPFYDTGLNQPRRSFSNIFQVWRQGKGAQSYERKDDLETDAMEILKKQGYVH
ncbi:type I phosphodiesterase/nucleotide pyrophosphatase [Leptospira ryugenii]|uniref:Type I phosphodiesterase/nucleotide pyrophosphatase n=1 Tax=Leptospira ryugenii TaxID=1917863 RepID=A0A2P2E1V4_9LEPT|nr:type I phosphodiesterase/nucleotide pyrophosphatase [Leptospira ryugenii]